MFYPKVSIVTASYNQAQYLEKTIYSVLNQSYKNIEYIIIDGGSTDGSIEIIKKYQKKLSYWISEADEGMYEAINKGLKKASGDICAYLNADDLYFLNTVKTVVEHFQENPDTDIIYGDCDYIDSKENFLHTYHYPPFKWLFFIILNWSSIPQPTVFWRRKVHERIGYFDTSFKIVGDFEFFARAGKCSRIDHIKSKLACFRIHKESLGINNRAISSKEIFRIHQRYGISNSFSTICIRYWADLRIKLPNLPFILKKALNWLVIIFEK